ncbi:MAG: pilus assembly protein TadG-related protein [Actinomycetota bacterium]
MRGLMTRLRDERGVSAIIVAIALVLLFGAAALSIDAGSVWKTRRDLITDTDAAALAAARYLSGARPGACLLAAAQGRGSAAFQEALSVLGENDLRTELEPGLEGFQIVCVGEAGLVRVRARLGAHLTFAPVLGFNDIRVFSGSTAQFGPLSSVTNLRPIGLCAADEHIGEWIAAQGNPNDPVYKLLRGLPDPTTPGLTDHPEYAGAGVVHRIPFTKSQDSDCGDSEGNWGWLDFNGNEPPNGADALKEWLLDGYDGFVYDGSTYPPTLGGNTPGDEDCEVRGPDDNSPDPCEGNPGANDSTKSALNEILCPAGTAADNCPFSFPVVVYDTVTGTGSNAEYHLVGFLGVVLRGYNKVTGQQGQGGGQDKDKGKPLPPRPTDNDPWFDLEFVWYESGDTTIGSVPSSVIPALWGVQLCGVDKTEKCDV